MQALSCKWRKPSGGVTCGWGGGGQLNQVQKVQNALVSRLGNQV